MRVVIVSFGSAGRRYLRSIKAETPDCDVALVRRADMPDPPEGVSAVLTSLEAAAAWRPDVAVIASPAPFHAEAAIALAGAGADVMIEKPIADTVVTARRMAGEIDASGVFAVVCYVLRASPWLQAVREVAASGRLGRCLSAHLCVGQSLRTWRPDSDYRETVTAQSALGGGALLELSHEIDAALWLFGRPHSVSATTARVSDLQIDVEDMAELTLRYQADDGAVGPLVTVHMDLCRPVPRRTIEICGENGVLSACALTGRITIATPSGESEICAPCPIDGDALFRSQWRTFLNDRKQRRTDLSTVADGLRAFDVIDAARRSNAEGQAIALS